MWWYKTFYLCILFKVTKIPSWAWSYRMWSSLLSYASPNFQLLLVLLIPPLHSHVVLCSLSMSVKNREASHLISSYFLNNKKNPSSTITKYQNHFKMKSPLLFFPMSVYDLSCKHDLSNSHLKEQAVYTQKLNWPWLQHCNYMSMQNSGHWPFSYLCRAELTLQCQVDVNDSNCL